MKFNYKKYTPHAAAIIIFALISLIYFKPLLSGKVLKQHDIAMHRGMSKEITDYREKYHTEPLWTNSMFGGMPAYQISTLYAGNWLSKLDVAFKLYLPHPGGYLFLYCLGFFILLLCLEVNVWLALIGGLAYGLSSYFLIIIQAGHNSKANALGYLPALLGGIILLFRGRYWLGISVTALFTAMELNANHVQIAYYGYMLIGFVLVGYFINAIKERQLQGFLKAFSFFIIACIIGALPNAGNLLTTNEYGKFSNRGKAELTITSDLKSNKDNISSSGLDKDYATAWSYGIGETFSFLIPDFKGGGDKAIGMVDQSALKKVNPDFRDAVERSNVYFGDQPGTSGPVYIGAIIIFLAFLGMFIIKNPIKWPLFCATLLTVALGWGQNFKPLTYFFMDYVPGYNKFRAVSMIMVIAELTLPLFAILAVNEAFKIKNFKQKIRLNLLKKEIEFRKLFIISLSVIAGFCLICFLMPDLVNTFHSTGEEEEIVSQYIKSGESEKEVKLYVTELMPQLEKARKAIFTSDAMRSLIFILLAAGALYLFFTNKVKKELLLTAIGIFILIDLWTLDKRYLNDKSFVSDSENKQYVSGKTLADEEILKDPAMDYRVLNLTVSSFNDASTSFYHKSIGGYHGAKLRRYVDLIDFHLRQEINSFYKNAGKAFSSDSSMKYLFASLNVINMLNTKYFIIPGGEEGKLPTPLKNTECNGNAWFIKSLTTVNSPDSEIVGLYKVETKTQAVLNAKYKSELGLKDNYSGAGEIKLTSYEPNDLIYESNTSAEEFAVFSEIYYAKGWNAYIDGQLKPHANVNYVLRGMNIPAGKHKVEFKFEPQTYTNGNKIALFGSVILFLTIGLGLFLNIKKNVIVS